MTEQEHLMYQIIEKLHDNGVPMIFKGALVTKLILIENGYQNLRNTRDIDASWIGTPTPSADELVEIVNKALYKLHDGLYATIKRKHTIEGQTAGLDILDTTNTIIASIDIDMRFVEESNKIYNYQGMCFKGVLPDEILADKISVLSSDKIFRRMKDVTDVYGLSQCIDIQTSKIFDICQTKNSKIDIFQAFYNRQPELENAYNKLSGIENKLPFTEVYSHLDKFIRPFVEKNNSNQIWNHKTQVWSELNINNIIKIVRQNHSVQLLPTTINTINNSINKTNTEPGQIYNVIIKAINKCREDYDWITNIAAGNVCEYIKDESSKIKSSNYIIKQGLTGYNVFERKNNDDILIGSEIEQHLDKVKRKVECFAANNVIKQELLEFAKSKTVNFDETILEKNHAYRLEL